MKQTLHRLFCLLLCAVMVVGMIPATASAAQYEEKIVEEPIEGYAVNYSDDGIITYTPTTVTREKKVYAPVGEAEPLSFPAGNAIQKDEWGNYTFETFAELKKLCAGTYSDWTTFTYVGSGSLIIDEDLTIPRSLSLDFFSEKYSVIIAKGATLTIEGTGHLTCDHLKVNGTLDAHEYITVNKTLTVNGKLNADSYVDVEQDTVITGAENIIFTEGDCFRIDMSVNTFKELKEAVALAKANPDIYYRIQLSIWNSDDSLNITSSLNIPANADLKCYSAWTTLTVDSGATLTLNRNSNLSCKLVVKGKLVNNGRLYFQGDSLKFTSTGSYSGKGSLVIPAKDNTNAYTDIVTGLDTENLDITEYQDDWEHYWQIRDVSDLTRLSAPTNLTWNKYLQWDAKTGTYKESTYYGAIRFTAGKVNDQSDQSTCFNVCLYRNNKLLDSRNWWFTSSAVKNGVELYINLNSFNDFTSGKYHFTVQAIASDSEYYDSPIVKSPTWTYTKPSSRYSRPTGLKWTDNAKAVWKPDSSSLTHHQFELYYAPTKSAEKKIIDWGQGEMTNWQIGHWHFRNYGPGYYYIRVRSMSGNINKKYHSAWTELSPAFHYTGKETPAKPTLTVYSDASGKPRMWWEAAGFVNKIQIYRATSKTGDYKHLKTVDLEYDSWDFIDESATMGKTYYYKVRAISISGIKSAFSSPKSCRAILAQPQVSITNDASSGKPVVKWNSVSGADKYYIYRATSQNGKYTKVSSAVSARSYKDTKASVGKVYYYYVVAVDNNSANNSFGSYIVSTRCDLKRPVVNITLTSGGDPYLKWNEISGAKKYEIYRATSASGTYKKIKSTTAEKYVDKDVTAGKTYYYKVKAIHSNSGANSAFSAVDKIKAK